MVCNEGGIGWLFLFRKGDIISVVRFFVFKGRCEVLYKEICYGDLFL